MQKTESELRDELSTCVTKAASDMDKKRIAELEKNEATIRLENEKLKVSLPDDWYFGSRFTMAQS